jgi:hypothetical protein
MAGCDVGRKYLSGLHFGFPAFSSPYPIYSLTALQDAARPRRGPSPPELNLEIKVLNEPPFRPRERTRA